MKITREINGELQSFLLTPREMVSIYFEQQYIFDKNDCAEALYDPEVFHDLFGDRKISPEDTEMLIENMAVEMRRNIDKYDMDWTYAKHDAMRHIAGRYLAGDFN